MAEEADPISPDQNFPLQVDLASNHTIRVDNVIESIDLLTPNYINQNQTYLPKNVDIDLDQQHLIESFLAREKLKFINESRKTISQPDIHPPDIQLLPLLNLHIATHNIRGLKSNMNKLTYCIELMNTYDLDILALNETNLDEQACRFPPLTPLLQQSYASYWAPSATTKKLGSGVGLIVNK